VRGRYPGGWPDINFNFSHMKESIQKPQGLGGYSGLAMVGTAQTIADETEEWLDTEASDGFTVMFPYLPGGLDDAANRSCISSAKSAIGSVKRKNLNRNFPVRSPISVCTCRD
jgi:hypothetical protein